MKIKIKFFFLFLLISLGLSAQEIFIVNSPDDYQDVDLADKFCADQNGNCTLRAAIENANKYPEKTEVHFDIPEIGPHRITLDKNLPTITETIFLDATTQKFYQPGCPQIIIDGTGVPWVSEKEIIENEDSTPTGFKLDGNSNGSLIKGFVIGGFGGKFIDSNGKTEKFSFGMGIMIKAEKVHIESNFIGVDSDGITKFGNLFGIALYSDNNTIGSYDFKKRNLISGNEEGILISSQNNKIIGNYVGTDWRGEGEVEQRTGLGFTVIGINNLTDSNLISGNNIGIHVAGNKNSFLNNIIGSNLDQTKFFPNQEKGIIIESSTENVVGLPGQGNVIVGNEVGLYFEDTRLGGKLISYAKKNHVVENYFGTNKQENLKLPNSVAIYFSGGHSNVIDNNTIALSREVGILMKDTQLNTLKNNYIGTNCLGNVDLSNTIGIKMVAKDTFCSYNTIRNNVISGPIDSAIELVNAEYNCFEENKIIFSAKKE